MLLNVALARVLKVSHFKIGVVHAPTQLRVVLKVFQSDLVNLQRLAKVFPNVAGSGATLRCCAPRVL